MNKAIIQMYVNSDMQEIENILNNNIQDLEILKKLHRKIDGKYQTCIKDWYVSMWGWVPKFGFNYEFLDVTSLIENLQTMLFKLSAFSMDLNSINKEDKSMIFQPVFNNNNNNNNSNYTQINNKIDFIILKEQFEKNENFSTEEKEEILEKIDELEQLYNSALPKDTKWNCLKNILKWIADKGIDIGIAFLPIIYQAINQ